MRLFAMCLLLVGGVGVGCAQKATRPPRTQLDAPAVDPYDDAISASALVFDPPVLAGEWAPDLARESRQPSAFVGYDEVTTTYFYLRTDDRQLITDWAGDRYERRAISEKYGVRYR